MLEDGATHVGVATDHVIESFRNDLWPGYKTGAGVDPALLNQFALVEEVLAPLGVVVCRWSSSRPTTRLAAAARMAAADERVEQVVICTPDKDLGAVRRAGRVVQLDRRSRLVVDDDGVRAKFGVPRRPSPTTSRSSATPPTASLAWPAGGRSPRPSSSPDTAGWTTSRRSSADWDLNLPGAPPSCRPT